MNMKNVIRFMAFVSVICVLTLGLTSCSEKAKALRQLEQLAEEVEENGDNYTIGEWQEVFHQYQVINSVIEKHYFDYSQRERNRILEARSEIKQKAMNSMMNKLDMFPALKQGILNIFNSLFGTMETDSYNRLPSEE